MKEITFEKTSVGYVAYFRVTGDITLHLEFEKKALPTTFVGMRSTEEGEFSELFSGQMNPVDGDFQIGNGKNSKYVIVRCTLEPKNAQYGGDNVTPIEG